MKGWVVNMNERNIQTVKPWEEKFAWFWYNDDEIFKYTEADFEERARELHERGVTVIMTFSLTHFRLGYYPYWNEINECIRKLVSAFHKYGMRVVEHHSAHLTSRLLDDGGWESFERNLFTYSRGKAKLDTWKKVFPFLTYDFKINGRDIRTFAQIDGRTGEPCRNAYGAYSMCFNNPDYRETYFTYLKDVVKTGIDGIMNDDVQYFGDGNSCTCEHCRKLFLEQTGYTLPQPEDWEAFCGDYTNPAYIAWKKFKFESSERMYRGLTEFYREQGVSLIRPNYCSDILKHCPTCYSFDRCCDIWDFIFQENCFSAVMHQSYMDFMVEAIHRYAAAKRRGVPSMSMFYPDRADSVYFSWALARSWGQLYTGTCEGLDITPLEAPYRKFEKDNIRFYTNPQKLADVSFYFSRRTRDYTADALDRYMSKMLGCMQAAYVSNIGLDMVMEEDDVSELCRHKTIVAAYAAMISDEELDKLGAYVKKGGRLVILGDFAVFDETGRPRSEAEINEFLDMDRENGELIRSAFRPETDEFQPTIWSDRRVPKPEPSPAVPSKWEAQKNGSGRTLREILGETKISLACANERVAATAYEVENALALHLVNLKDTISVSAEMTAHTDIIKNFAAGGEAVPEIILSIELPGGAAPKKAYLKTPERAEENALQIRISGDRAELKIPGGLFSGYALVVLER